jgi:hypothetical protein
MSAAPNAVQVVRIFGHGLNPEFVLQREPGKYNEAAFRGLDRVLDAAARWVR